MLLSRRFSQASLAVMFLSSCLSCGSAHSGDEYFVFVSANLQVPYWQTAGAGFAKAGDQLKVRTAFVGPQNFDPAAERAALDQAVQKQATGQIGREAVGNALRYAKARSVRLRLGFTNVNIELSIEDDGIGFRPDHPTVPKGFGLSTMRQRASRIDATFTLRTSPGTGTAIRISAPCPAFSDPL